MSARPNAVSTAVSGRSAPSAYGHGSPHDDVGGEVEAQEERAPDQRVGETCASRAIVTLASATPARSAGEHEAGELAAAGGHRVMPQ